MPGPVFIQGDGIDLRTIEEEDIEFLQAGTNHPAVRQYAGGDLPYNRRRYEEGRFATLSEGEFLQLLVCDGDERLGDVSLGPIDDRRGWANLGFWIHPDHQGKGTPPRRLDSSLHMALPNCGSTESPRQSSFPTRPPSASLKNRICP